MAMYAVPGETLTGIANAIRSKTGSDEQMPVSAMAAAIEGISGGGQGVVLTKTFDQETKIKDAINEMQIPVDGITDGLITIVHYGSNVQTQGTITFSGLYAKILDGIFKFAYYGSMSSLLSPSTLSVGWASYQSDLQFGIVDGKLVARDRFTANAYIPVGNTLVVSITKLK